MIKQPDLDVVSKARVQAHADGILSNWAARWNDECGGFDCYIRADGSVSRPGEQRPLVMQARLLYNFSEGILHGQSAYAELAARTYAYMVARLRTNEGWYQSLGRSRNPRDQDHYRPEQLNTYDNLFVVIAYAKYYKATSRPEVGVEALRLFELINTLCGDEDLAQHGVRSVYRPQQKGSVGGFDRWQNTYSGNTMLHYLEAVVNLEEAGLGNDNRQRLAELRTLFMNNIYDAKRQVVHDDFKQSFAQPNMDLGGRTSQGHALEWIDFFRVIDEFALSEEVERNLLDGIASRAIADTGLFVNSYFYAEAMSAGSVDFWGQAESVKTYNLASSLYGFPYADYGRKLLTAYFTYFVDADEGVFMNCDRNGVVLNHRKGDSWKCDYHSMRMCVDLLDRQGGFLSE